MNNYLDFKCSQWFLKSKNTYLTSVSQWFLFTRPLNQCFVVLWYRDTPFCIETVLLYFSLMFFFNLTIRDFSDRFRYDLTKYFIFRQKVDFFGSSYDWISFDIKAFCFVIHSSASLLLTSSLFFLNWETSLKVILEEVPFTVKLSSKNFKESKNG